MKPRDPSQREREGETSLLEMLDLPEDDIFTLVEVMVLKNITSAKALSQVSYSFYQAFSEALAAKRLLQLVYHVGLKLNSDVERDFKLIKELITVNPSLIFRHVSVENEEGELIRISPLKQAIANLDVCLEEIFLEAAQKYDLENNDANCLQQFYLQASAQRKPVDLTAFDEMYDSFRYLLEHPPEDEVDAIFIQQAAMIREVGLVQKNKCKRAFWDVACHSFDCEPGNVTQEHLSIPLNYEYPAYYYREGGLINMSKLTDKKIEIGKNVAVNLSDDGPSLVVSPLTLEQCEAGKRITHSIFGKLEAKQNELIEYARTHRKKIQ